MRRVAVALVLAVCVEVLAPAPAYAWWEWADKLSGPGWFNGPQFELRMVCFGDSLEKEWDLVRTARAKSLLAEAATGGEAWKEAEQAWTQAAMSWKVLAASLSGRIETADGLQSAADARQRANHFKEVTSALTEATDRAVIAKNSVGVIWSACSSEKVRRTSIDLGVGRWRTAGQSTSDNPLFAGGERITLTTFMPSFSWHVFSDSGHDVLDAAIGAGVYWFTSPGFTSFSGVILEPGRLDFHAPSSWSMESFKNSKRRWAALLTFRVGLLIFPGGFEKGAFAATGDKAVRIPAELTHTYSLFLNLEPLVRHWHKSANQ